MMAAPSFLYLNKRLEEVECLLGLCQGPDDPPAQVRSRIERSALLRGALVLLCSHIEGFFEGLVEDALQAIDCGVSTISSLPKDVRMRQVIRDSARLSVNNINKQWNFIRDIYTSPFLVDENPHVPGNIDCGIHIEKFANPGTSEIKYLMGTIGINDCWKDFESIEPRKSYKNEIDAIVSRRNQIAHGDMNSSVSENDISGYILNFRHTAKIFSILIQNYVNEYVPNFKWDEN